jgi:hypothetical protein
MWRDFFSLALCPTWRFVGGIWTHNMQPPPERGSGEYYAHCCCVCCLPLHRELIFWEVWQDDTWKLLSHVAQTSFVGAGAHNHDPCRCTWCLDEASQYSSRSDDQYCSSCHVLTQHLRRLYWITLDHKNQQYCIRHRYSWVHLYAVFIYFPCVQL